MQVLVGTCGSVLKKQGCFSDWYFYLRLKYIVFLLGGKAILWSNTSFSWLTNIFETFRVDWFLFNPEAMLFGRNENSQNIFPEFSMLENATMEHKFNLSLFQPTDPKNFIKFLRKEIQLLRTSLPKGIHVKCFEDRMVRRDYKIYLWYCSWNTSFLTNEIMVNADNING